MSSKRALVISLLINLFLLGLCLIFGNLAFGATDDYFMARLLEGVYGEDYNVHLTFVNVLYGYALLPFYYLFPKIGWYYIGEMTGVFLSFTTIGTIIIKRAGMQWGPLLALLFSAAFASDCYLSVQFTQCAALYSATGMLLFALCSSLQKDAPTKKKLILLIASLFFLIWGAVMRREACLMGMPFLALALLINVKDCWINKKWVITGLALLFIGINAIQWIDKKHYEAPDYKYYKQFQSVRATIGDGAFFEESSVADDLDERNLYREDFHLLRNWIFYDKEVFAVDSLKNYLTSAYTNKRTLNHKSILGSLIPTLSFTTDKPMFWIWLLLSVVIFSSKKGNSYAWGSLIIIAGLTGYLLILSRVVFRVELGFWLYATILAVAYIRKLPETQRKYSLSLTSIVIAFIFGVFCLTGDMVRNQTNGRNMSTTPKPLKHYDEALSYIRSLPPDQIVLTSHTPYMFFIQKMNPPYLSESFGNWKKIIPIGYWTPFFPDIEKHLHSIGINNPLKDVTKNNVIVVSNGQLADYLQRHYNVEVDVTTIRSFNGLTFYKYSVKSPEIP